MGDGLIPDISKITNDNIWDSSGGRVMMRVMSSEKRSRATCMTQFCDMGRATEGGSFPQMYYLM